MIFSKCVLIMATWDRLLLLRESLSLCLQKRALEPKLPVTGGLSHTGSIKLPSTQSPSGCSSGIGHQVQVYFYASAWLSPPPKPTSTQPPSTSTQLPSPLIVVRKFIESRLLSHFLQINENVSWCCVGGWMVCFKWLLTYVAARFF